MTDPSVDIKEHPSFWPFMTVLNSINLENMPKEVSLLIHDARGKLLQGHSTAFDLLNEMQVGAKELADVSEDEIIAGLIETFLTSLCAVSALIVRDNNK